MKFVTIRKCGKLGIELPKINGNGAIVTREFLNELIGNIVKRATDYFDETEENIFTRKEKQLLSIICPSIADLTYDYVMEQPLRRKPSGEDEYPGRVDYWINYKNYSYLMELKHCDFAFKNADYPNKFIFEQFNSALEQLSNIRSKQRESLTVNKGLFRIALQTIAFYQSSNDNAKDIDIKKSFMKLIKNRSFNKEPNLRSLWLLHEELKEPVVYNNRVQTYTYPAIAFIGYIS